MTVLLVHEYDYERRSDLQWSDDMARYIRHGFTEVPAKRVFRLEETGAGEVEVTDITDEANEQLEQAADPSPICHKYSSRYAAYEAQRLGGAA